MLRVSVIDYGLSNLFSVTRALAYVGAEVEIVTTAEAIRRARVLVLPGVGAFGDGMKNLEERGLVEPILEAAGAGRPLLGICLGMQLLFETSEEFEGRKGLGLLKGGVVRLQGGVLNGREIKVPHIGWKELSEFDGGTAWRQSIFQGLRAGDSAYFVHSYVPEPTLAKARLARMSYGGRDYCAAVEDGPIAGCQFHPEKSGPVGLKILHNFVTRN